VLVHDDEHAMTPGRLQPTNEIDDRTVSRIPSGAGELHRKEKWDRKTVEGTRHRGVSGHLELGHLARQEKQLACHQVHLQAIDWPTIMEVVGAPAGVAACKSSRMEIFVAPWRIPSWMNLESSRDAGEPTARAPRPTGKPHAMVLPYEELQFKPRRTIL
jgi:hypothetical protein